ncbi:MAG: HAMP domain-containing histidine kinase [Nitratireductor sp.]|nr:HAMP domain-containing histidine kinase [Nitratireductor sp.]MCC0022514.1 HAMP domain-containing histidine kinase [Nitratireductor sp.]
MHAPAPAGDKNTGRGSVAANRRSAGRASLLSGLPGKLLLLTVIFVMIAEVLILVPSIANFRNVWLQNHLDTAEAASIVYLDDSNIMLSEMAQRQLLAATQSLSVSIREGEVTRLMAATPNDRMIREEIDLGTMRPIADLRSTLSTLFFGGDRIYRVAGPMKSRTAVIQLIQEDRFLRNAMLVYTRNILLISLVISLITATLVYLALFFMIVRPIIRMSENMKAFAENPESSALVYMPSGRNDEIGLTEDGLSALQTDLQAQLRQKQHLADLGLAVSKINHDLRNILASTQIFTDRMVDLPDPAVQRLAPKLIRTIDRAAGYTRQVLDYGKAVERAPELRLLELEPVICDVFETLGLDQKTEITGKNDVPPGLQVKADSEQLFRIILNICRNSVQAMESHRREGKTGLLAVAAQQEGRVVTIRIRDNGPGIPEMHRAGLFKPFQASGKVGGTGLGLSIASELARAHGGGIVLESSGAQGTVFAVSLPAAN